MNDEVFCTCGCGKASVVVTGPALGRVRCHCTICQKANQAPFADSMILRAKYVPLDRIEHVRFESMKKPPALQRGFCRSCGSFVMAHKGSMLILPFTFVPAVCYPQGVTLREPDMHVYYAYRIADVADELPKYDAWPSVFAILRVLLRARSGRGGV